jgi:hypothetical protein
MAAAPATPTYQRRDSEAGELDSDSDSSQRTSRSTLHRSPYAQTNKQSTLAPINTSHDLPRPPPIRAVNDLPLRAYSPTTSSPSTFGSHFGHRPRQRSQGYFEPTLASSSNAQSGNMSNLTASQAAAQAAMHVQSNNHGRNRSTTIPEPGTATTASANQRRPAASPPPMPNVQYASRSGDGGMQYQNGIVGGQRIAATTAANAAFPRSPLHSPGLPPQKDYAPSPVEREMKPPKEKSKMKLFSKPKSIGISKDKDFDKKHPPLPSPGKMAMTMHSTGPLNRIMNASTTSLTDPTMSSSSSLYSSANASTSTLVPMDRMQTYAGAPEKEKHKHHFLSRQKNKLKDKDDHHLPLSSANSNTKPINEYTTPLYSFAAPSSPGHGVTSFAKSKSGLDLRHGGKALREKKKDEKAAAAAAMVPYGADTLDAPFRERPAFSSTSSEWPGPGSLGTASQVSFGPSPGASQAYASNLGSLGTTFGLSGLSADDAWPLLKAKLLHIFEGEDPRPPIEDFNALVTVHLRRCIEKRQPTTIIEDFRELLQTGFLSLDQTLKKVPDDRLIPALVEMWMIVFPTILPFLQAVFLPLDLEFKGRGPLMSARDAAEFWGATLPGEHHSETDNSNIPTLGEDLDVRRITLLIFRDTVILPRHDSLMAIFSRLLLENLSAGIIATDQNLPFPSDSASTIHRPSTASTDPAFSSYNSQGSTLLDTPGSTSPLRSRATSNTSAGSFPSLGQQSPRLQARAPAPMDSSKVTETVGRMLQCVSVLASVQSGDDAQAKMERLTKELKHNWLGRGRTGRQRRGFVGTKLPRGLPSVA